MSVKPLHRGRGWGGSSGCQFLCFPIRQIYQLLACVEQFPRLGVEDFHYLLQRRPRRITIDDVVERHAVHPQHCRNLLLQIATLGYIAFACTNLFNFSKFIYLALPKYHDTAMLTDFRLFDTLYSFRLTPCAPRLSSHGKTLYVH